jgi:hypothetical protein
MTDKKKKLVQIEAKISKEFDADKRKTLSTLAKAVWVIPIVATFSLGSLKTSNVWAQAPNSTTSS